jgi:hypothetical protein
MPADHSHLTSLAALAKGVEARTPIPAPVPATVTADSGLIDLHAIQRMARESEAAAKATAARVRAAMPPIPAAYGGPSDDEIDAMAPKGFRRKKLLAFAGGGLAVIAIAVAWLVPRSSADVAPEATAKIEAPAAPAAPAAPMMTSTAETTAALAAAAPIAAPPATASTKEAAPPTGKTRGSKGRRPTARPAAHGPKMTKVTSSGT